MNEITTMLHDKAFLQNLYGFAYKRTNSAHEAEDLCQDIVVTALAAAQRNSHISNPHAFFWTIARRVYADFLQKRNSNAHTGLIEGAHTESNPIDSFIDDENDSYQLRRIFMEISFLAKIYRDVCIMYYLDELKIPAIAQNLGISENTVKQRLYSARETIKKGVQKMETNQLLKPTSIQFIGTGNPYGNDPRTVAQRSFSQSLLYLCRDTERSVKELSTLLGMPMPYVEEEVEIQLAGENGHYGNLRKTDSGKYIANVIIVNIEDVLSTNDLYRERARALARKFCEYVKTINLLGLPFLNQPESESLILWPLLHRVSNCFTDAVKSAIAKNHLADITPTKREFYSFGMAVRDVLLDLDYAFYGCDGSDNHAIGGYKRIFMSNLYGRRLEKHFSCNDNVFQDGPLLTIRAIGGLPLSQLSESEKETAARAMEEGYITKKGDSLHPRILVSEKDVYWAALENFQAEIDAHAAPLAAEIHKKIKKHVPKHLLGEWEMFVIVTSNIVADELIEECIRQGSLIPPEKPLSAAGVIMIVDK
ncbi:MAG: RNA polymerase sigma factor [Defluviitaleaceae bacterium]|nr:RNA polymerase sigma factor [Defluviitaleaceae bacterium]